MSVELVAIFEPDEAQARVIRRYVMRQQLLSPAPSLKSPVDTGLRAVARIGKGGLRVLPRRLARGLAAVVLLHGGLLGPGRRRGQGLTRNDLVADLAAQMTGRRR